MAAVERRASPRLHFANQLRGLAALSVLISHLVGVFWLVQGFLELTTLAPAQGGAVPPLVIATNVEWFQPGPFGVGLFFLISGLVVPISLDRHTALSFVAARGLRIYPTYWAGLALQLLVLTVASHIWGRPVPYDWTTILTNAFLVHDLVGRPSIDLVNWTLSIEVRFYVLVALLAPLIRRGSLAAVFGPSVLAGILALLLSQGIFGPLILDSSRLTYTASSELPFLVIMLTGVLFNYHVRAHLTTLALIGGVCALAAVTTFAWWFSVLHGQFTHVLINDGYALALFSAAYAARRRISVNRVLDRLAAISYPLYLVHATLGFFVMKALMLLGGIGYWPALATAILAAGLASSFLHLMIEKPSIRAGHALASLRVWRPARVRLP